MENGILRRTSLVRNVGQFEEKDMALGTEADFELLLGRVWAGRNIISGCGVYTIKNRENTNYNSSKSADGPETAHTTSESNTENDRGSQRIKIRLQVARGLSYPHTSEGDKQEIVYCDIKIANILLGENLDARVDDFGLYKFLSMNEKHKGKAGTRVYMDPQYAKEGMVGPSRDTIGDTNGIKLTDSSVSPQTNNKSLRNEFLQGKLKARADVVMTENEIYWLY
ncbi:kinase-like domain-containing protein [Tanacetum coccineum]